MMNSSILKIGVVGMGGYARSVTDKVLRYSPLNGPHLNLVATCDPEPSRHSARIEALRARGVELLADIDAILRLPLHAVWLPVPIHLHRPFAEQSLAAGKAVLVEKPAAGCIDDVDGMIAARDRAGVPIAVGFQHLFDPATWQAKRKLLAGAIGKPKRASVFACWPRDQVYYSRNAWAGKLRHGGVWVLDSPANNAMAHFVNLALFLLGPSERDSAEPIAVEAELYRANPIENYDTCTIRLHLPGNVELLVALTHACNVHRNAAVTLHGDAGTMEFAQDDEYVFRPAKGEQVAVRCSPDLFSNVISGFAAYWQGDPAAEYASLENARTQSSAISATSQAATVRTVPSDRVKTTTIGDGTALRFVPDIDMVLKTCAENGTLLGESNMIDWCTPAKRLSLSGYRQFRPAE